MNDSHYIRLGLTVRGPYSVSELHELGRRGGFSKAHDVSVDKKSWTSASDRPELFPEARRAAILDRGLRPDGSTGRSESAGSKSEESNANAGPSNQAHSSATPQESRDISAGDGSSSRTDDQTSPVLKLSGKVIATVVAGSAGFVLLMVCTAIVVTRIRASPFVPSANIGLIALLLSDVVSGTIALIIGHLAVKEFHSKSGTVKERNLIVIGLSCGYSILILCVLYVIVLVISAFSTTSQVSLGTAYAERYRCFTLQILIGNLHEFS